MKKDWQNYKAKKYQVLQEKKIKNEICLSLNIDSKK